MGMFDEVNEELFCPFCCNKVNGWQTKDLTDSLTCWSFKEIKKIYSNEKFMSFNIYTDCKQCGKWIELKIKVRNL